MLPLLDGEADHPVSPFGPECVYTPSEWLRFQRIFWSRVDRSGGPDTCWPWTKQKNDHGYGRVIGRLVPERAHRVAFALANGPIPNGLDVLHSCDNPPCCNPAHLRAGTKSQNMKDAYRRGRKLPIGKRGEEHHASVVTEDQVRQIRSRRDEDRQALAAEFGMSVSGVDKIRNGATWRHVS